MRGVVPRDLDDLDGLQASDFEAYQIVEKDDLLFKLIDLQNIKTSRVGLVPCTGIVSPAYIRLCVIEGRLLPRYAYWYFFRLYVLNVFNELGGGVRQTLGPEDLLSLPIVVPAVSEQHAICAFLDREAAMIDALIAEQERLIELLQEKRQALISHAVTKGLNSRVPIKDSGIEWLGDVPAHWCVVPLKRVLEVRDGTHSTPEYVEPAHNTYPLITSKDFGGTEILFEDAKHISLEDHLEVLRRSNTEAGDVLMSMIGGNIGKALVVRTERSFSIKNVALFKTCQSRYLAEYLLYYLQSGLLDVQIDLISRGGAQRFLGLGDIRSLTFFKMPAEEVRDIVETLKSRLHPLRAVIEAAERSLVLLQERRSALISAAVTGQIDVRGLVEQEAA